MTYKLDDFPRESTREKIERFIREGKSDEEIDEILAEDERVREEEDQVLRGLKK